MKIFYTVLVLIVLVLAVIFAAENSAPVTLAFFSSSTVAPLSLVLVLTLVLGFALGALIMTPAIWKRSRHSAGLRKMVAKLEKEKAALGQDAAGEAGGAGETGGAAEAPGAKPAQPPEGRA
jgi:uncharacterized integral membrane protein